MKAFMPQAMTSLGLGDMLTSASDVVIADDPGLGSLTDWTSTFSTLQGVAEHTGILQQACSVLTNQAPGAPKQAELQSIHLGRRQRRTCLLLLLGKTLIIYFNMLLECHPPRVSCSSHPDPSGP